MRTSILLFLTLISFLSSCTKDNKTVHRMDLDAQDFLIFNKNSYWIYERSDSKKDTITLVDIETGIKDNHDGENLTEYRIDKYWSSAEEEYFERTSEDVSLYLFNTHIKAYEYTDVFKFKNKFHTYITDISLESGYFGQDFFIKSENLEFPIGTDKYYVKEIYGDNTYKNSGDTLTLHQTKNTTTIYAKGIGMISHKYETSDTIWDLTLESFYLAP